MSFGGTCSFFLIPLTTFVKYTQLASLQACTYSLETANQTVALSVETLREATADFPRLAVALANKKVSFSPSPSFTLGSLSSS
ncbi:hypothetical protein A4X06_0g4080 [Tilletia controversa]|uniref:Outer kinetochore protein SPC19 n=1 Tax=Tilletia controversa TaxID=13291 RepID=A0A8X7SXD3_9BASI|nr:hypothetical protein A4X06_0g4080 [Tilletia controversa]